MRSGNLAIFVALFVVLVNFPVQAQLSAENGVISVKNRYDPDYGPLGGRLGSFKVMPKISLAETFDDNIFRISSGTQSDFITGVNPEIVVKSDWNLHEVSFQGSGDLGYYFDHTSENYHDYRFGPSGRIDLDYETSLTGSLVYQRGHEDRGSPDDANSDEPVEYDMETVTMTLKRALGLIKFYVSGQYRRHKFENSSRAGLTVDNSSRNRSQKTLETKLAYDLGYNYEAFVSLKYDKRDYDSINAFFRNSHGYETKTGVALNISGKTRADLYLGYIKQDYDNALGDIGDINFGGSLLWNITDMTSIKGVAERTVRETTLAGASGIIRTSGNIEVEHALLRNLFLGGYAGVDNDEYIGVLSNARDNRTYKTGFDIVFKPSRIVTTKFDYDYTKRDFDVVANDYETNRAMVSLIFSY